MANCGSSATDFARSRKDVHWVRFIESLAASPQTVVHGDAHIGNTYVLPNDEVGHSPKMFPGTSGL